MKTRKIYWPTTLFFILTPLVAAIALPIYLVKEGVPLAICIFALIYAILTNLSITAGYHRLFAHKAYDAHPLVKLFYLLVGASAWQGSALKWSSDHRRHHAKVDREEDPYSIKKGFWHAHMGWLFWRETVDQPIHAPDLAKDPLLRWQDRYYVPIAIVMSFGVPTWVGLIWDAPWAGFLFAGVVRTLLTQQSTFFVNSLSHTLGKQTYSEEVSARDSILVAILTHGEGYHNFHHTFQADYRNGIRWYHWDPTKWTIWTLAKLGLAKRLRKVSDLDILRARMQTEVLRLKAKGYSAELVLALSEQVVRARERLARVQSEVQQLVRERKQAQYESLKADLRRARAEWREAYSRWRALRAGLPFST